MNYYIIDLNKMVILIDKVKPRFQSELDNFMEAKSLIQSVSQSLLKMVKTGSEDILAAENQGLTDFDSPFLYSTEYFDSQVQVQKSFSRKINFKDFKFYAIVLEEGKDPLIDPVLSRPLFLNVVAWKMPTYFTIKPEFRDIEILTNNFTYEYQPVDGN